MTQPGVSSGKLGVLFKPSSLFVDPSPLRPAFGPFSRFLGTRLLVRAQRTSYDDDTIAVERIENNTDRWRAFGGPRTRQTIFYIQSAVHEERAQYIIVRRRGRGPLCCQTARGTVSGKVKYSAITIRRSYCPLIY